MYTVLLYCVIMREYCCCSNWYWKNPHKIMSGFSSLTADQLKNWVVYFPIMSLHRLTTWNAGDTLCWHVEYYVVSKLQRRRYFLLMLYCYSFAEERALLHMHCLLIECVFDYGPLYEFWLFPFERYNGLLGELPHNNRSIELQLMNWFIRDKSSLLPDEFKEELGLLILQAKHNVGSLLDSARPYVRPASCGWSVAIGKHYSIDFPSHLRGIFSSHEIDGLRELYSCLYSVPISVIDIPSCYCKYRTIKL